MFTVEIDNAMTNHQISLPCKDTESVCDSVDLNTEISGG